MNSEGDVGRTLNFEALVTEFAHIEENISFWAAHVWTAFIRMHWHFPQKFQLLFFMLETFVSSEFIVFQCFMRQHFYQSSTTTLLPDWMKLNHSVLSWGTHPRYQCRDSCVFEAGAWSGGYRGSAARAVPLRTLNCCCHCCMSTWCHELQREQ